jgi:hypothetical protein
LVYPNRDQPMLSARFLAMPAITLTVIVALAQAHGRPDMSQTETRPMVVRAVNCATPAANVDATCALAGNATAIVMR